MPGQPLDMGEKNLEGVVFWSLSFLAASSALITNDHPIGDY